MFFVNLRKNNVLRQLNNKILVIQVDKVRISDLLKPIIYLVDLYEIDYRKFHINHLYEILCLNQVESYS